MIVQLGDPRLTERLLAGWLLGCTALILTFALAGLADERLLPSGDGVWLKPLRFAAAFSIHTATLIWISALTERMALGDRLFALSVALQVTVMAVELTCISIQAWRGVPSHFNVATSFDRAIFTIMGIGTIGLFLGFLLIAAGVLRRPGNPVASRSVIIAMCIATLGGLSGVVMVMPSALQADIIATGVRPDIVGGHAVGAGAGGTLFFFGWELGRGDWRVPHFIGLHALQAIPLLAWLHGAGRVVPGHWGVGIGSSGYLLFFAWACVKTVSGSPAYPGGATDIAILLAAAALFASGIAIVLHSRR